MTLGELIDGLDVRLRVDDAAALRLRICDLTEDSRTVMPGSLFVARRGLAADGRAYAREAAAAGAVAILTDDPGLDAAVPVLLAGDVLAAAAHVAERFNGAPSRSLCLAAVTGTNGKTTISWLIWQLLNHAGIRCGLVGTVLIDDGRELAPAAMTTPPAIETSHTLATMRDAGCRAVALEASSHALDQRRLDALDFGVAIFTNLTGDHLDYHKTMDNYARAKARLFAGLRPDALAIVNAASEWAPAMLAGCRARVLRCRTGHGPCSEGEARCEAAASSLRGMRVRLNGPWGLVEGQTRLFGEHNLLNLLQAVAAAHELGLTTAQLATAIPSLTTPPGRLERVEVEGSDLQTFVDYAHSDDSLANVLSAARAAMSESDGSLWCIFGCGGDRDSAKRPRMGRIAAELADRVVVTSDNPRRERPGDIIDQILAGVPGELRARVAVEADRARAIARAVNSAEPGDVVLICGKGHEARQILPDGKGGTYSIEFDDRLFARGALLARRAAPSNA